MKIFIGSSNEQYPVVKEIRRDLMEYLKIETVEIVTWKEWFARGENYGLDTWTVIGRAIKYFDSAIMLLAGDDKTEVRDQECRSTRDNVLIESGAFASVVGIDKVFLLLDKRDKYRTPSDYRGLNAILFDYERGADNSGAYQTMREKILQIETQEVQNAVSLQSPDKYKNPMNQIKKGGKIK